MSAPDDRFLLLNQETNYNFKWSLFLLFVCIVLQRYLRMKVCLTISLGLKACDLCHCFAENENHLPVPPSMPNICMSHHQCHFFAENENHLPVPPSTNIVVG